MKPVSKEISMLLDMIAVFAMWYAIASIATSLEWMEVDGNEVMCMLTIVTITILFLSMLLTVVRLVDTSMDRR
jgi:hypothetical protein